jgi:hypothetical protein
MNSAPARWSLLAAWLSLLLLTAAPSSFEHPSLFFEGLPTMMHVQAGFYSSPGRMRASAPALMTHLNVTHRLLLGGQGSQIDVAESIDTLEEQSASHASQLASLSTEVQTSTLLLSGVDVSAWMNSVDAKLNFLAGSAHADVITLLQATVEQQADELQRMKKELVSLTQQNEWLEANLTLAEELSSTSDANLQSQLDSHGTIVTSLQGQLSANDAKDVTQQSTIDTLYTRVGTLELFEGSVTSALNVKPTQIASLNSNVLTQSGTLLQLQAANVSV